MIIIDNREKNSLVVSELINLGSKIDLRQLPVADYIINEIAIERKTASDFVSSIINRRLVKQLGELKQYKRRLLIVEGDLYENGFNPNAIKGMLLSVLLDFDVPIIFTEDSEETAQVLHLLAKKQGKPRQDVSLRVKKRTYSIAEQQQLIIEGLPGVGPRFAKALLKKFKTIKTIANASVEKLMKVDNLGEKRARVIKRILSERYLP
ncbi:MAG: ERCC4 domain-containing protein [Nanoarchaeota archaeon]